MQVLLIQASGEVREKMSFFLESSCGATVQAVDTFADAVSFLKKASPPVELVILDKKQGTSPDLDAFWVEVKSIPIVLCSQGSPAGAPLRGKIVGTFDRPVLMNGVSAAIDKLVRQGAKKEEA